MDQKIRTFIALEIGSGSRPQAFNLGKKLAEAKADIRWEPQEKLHITLKFLGEVPNIETVEICRLIQHTAAKFPCFVFRLKGAGAFPNIIKPRNVWIGVDEGAEEIKELADRIDRAMMTLGFPRELHPCVPHVTLGRLQRPTPEVSGLTSLLQQYGSYEAGKTYAQSITIFASHMARTGSSYTPMATAMLKKI